MSLHLKGHFQIDVWKYSLQKEGEIRENALKTNFTKIPFPSLRTDSAGLDRVSLGLSLPPILSMPKISVPVTWVNPPANLFLNLYYAFVLPWIKVWELFPKPCWFSRRFILLSWGIHLAGIELWQGRVLLFLTSQLENWWSRVLRIHSLDFLHIWRLDGQLMETERSLNNGYN